MVGSGEDGVVHPEAADSATGDGKFIVLTVLCVCVSSVVCKRARARQREKESKW